jgi:hypothetical protein
MARKIIGLIAICLLIAAAFAFGAAVERGQLASGLWRGRIEASTQPSGNWHPRVPLRGTFGAIDHIEGEIIQMRDARNGSVLLVRTGSDTIIELGRRGRIPLKDLRVGQRIFVIGNPNSGDVSSEFDARFIGVLPGQQQRYLSPAQPAVCVGCTD